MQITRKMHRAFSRDAKARQYRAGHVKVDDSATGPDADRVRAACAKRARKDAKRVRDVFQCEVAQFTSRERLDGNRGFFPTGIIALDPPVTVEGWGTVTDFVIGGAA